jgi:hypothetical protein
LTITGFVADAESIVISASALAACSRDEVAIAVWPTLESIGGDDV